MRNHEVHDPNKKEDESNIKRRILLSIVGVGALIAGVSKLFANVPHTFTANTAAKADEVNANFQYLVDQLNQLSQQVVQRTPVGTILPYGAATPPSGWFECNGENQSRTEYADLFSVIGSNYGSGDGLTTFTLPDLRGQFLRGWDHGIGNDPDAGTRSAQAAGGATGDNVGSVQSDAFQGHQHEAAADFNRLRPLGSDELGHNNLTINTGNPVSDGTNGTPRTASETRSKNVNVMYIIKY